MKIFFVDCLWYRVYHDYDIVIEIDVEIQVAQSEKSNEWERDVLRGKGIKEMGCHTMVRWQES